MATITINIPVDKEDAVLDAFAAFYSYQEFIGGSPNPQSKPAFAKEKIIDYMKQVYTSYQITSGSAAVKDEANTNAESLGMN